MKKLIVKIFIFPSYIFYLLKLLGIYDFPVGIIKLRGLFKLFNNYIERLISEYNNLIFNSLVNTKNKIITHDSQSSLWQDPLLKFQALWSLGNGSVNTPCPINLVKDLVLLVSLKGKKILCIGSKNNFETDLLISYGAIKSNITCIDLYSNIPGIIPMDFHYLKFADDTFDLIFWAGSFAYANDSERAAKEAVRVLKKPGILAVGDTLKGGATRDILMAGQPNLQEEINLVGQETIYFTHPFINITGIMKNFCSNDFYLEVLSARKYKPNHANLIMQVTKNTDINGSQFNF